MSVHNPNTCANPMAPLQRFRCLRPDHANVWDEHVLARGYDALAAERDQLAAEIEALRAEVGALRGVLGRILENEASDYKAAEEFGGYVLDDELREEARAVLSRREG